MTLQQTHSFKCPQWHWGLILPIDSVLITCAPPAAQSASPRSSPGLVRFNLPEFFMPRMAWGMAGAKPCFCFPHLSQPLPSVEAGALKAPRKRARDGGGVSCSTGVPHSGGSWKAYRLCHHAQDNHKVKSLVARS